MPDWLLFILDKIILSLFIGIFTSALFVFFLSKFKPKILISPKIAKRLGDDDNFLYSIKIVNKTKYTLVDIKAELLLRSSFQTSNGEVWRIKKVPLIMEDILSFNGFNKNDSDADYAYSFATYSKLDDIWSEAHQKVTFNIYAKHSLSGFGGFFTQDYGLKRVAIINGVFLKGDTFEIK